MVARLHAGGHLDVHHVRLRRRRGHLHLELLAGRDAGRNLHADLLGAVLHGELLAGRSVGRDGDGDRLHRW